MAQDPDKHEGMMMVVAGWVQSSISQFKAIECRANEFPDIPVLAPLREDLLAACNAGKLLSIQALLSLKADHLAEMEIRRKGCSEPERQASIGRLHESFMTFADVLSAATSRASQIELQMIATEDRYAQLDAKHSAELASLQGENKTLEEKLVPQKELEKREQQLLDLPLPNHPFYDVKFFASAHRCSNENVRRHFRNWRGSKEHLKYLTQCYFLEKDKDKAERFHRYLKANRRSSRSQPKPRRKHDN
jgi:hypothetical protein